MLDLRERARGLELVGPVELFLGELADERTARADDERHAVQSDLGKRREGSALEDELDDEPDRRNGNRRNEPDDEPDDDEPDDEPDEPEATLDDADQSDFRGRANQLRELRSDSACARPPREQRLECSAGSRDPTNRVERVRRKVWWVRRHWYAFILHQLTPIGGGTLQERRLGYRIPFETMVTSYVHDRPIRGLTGDLSDTGISLSAISMLAPPPGLVVGLEINLPEVEDSIWASGQICTGRTTGWPPGSASGSWRWRRARPA